MNSPAFGIAYSLCLRLRWTLAGIVTYLVVVAAAIQFASVEPVYVLISTLALTFVIAHLVNAFTFGPANLGRRNSGFPPNMFILPLSTRRLVGWPMLYGAATHAALWVLVSTFVLMPVGAEAPILWPAALLAACTAWVQAIGWSPFPSPFARVPALALALTPLILLGVWAGYLDTSRGVSWLVVVSSAIWTATAYATAVHGLSRARTGSDGDWFRAFVDRRAALIKKKDATACACTTSFHTSASAQLWHEIRRNAIFFPLLISLVAVPMFPLACRIVLYADHSNPGVMIGSIVISPFALALSVWIGIPMLLSGLFGPALGKFDVWAKEPIPPFFAARPMTTAQFVAIKFKAATISALMVWGLMIGLLSLWALVEASPLNPRPSLVRAALAAATPRHLVAGVAVALASLAWILREILVGLWITLTGRAWVSNTLGTAFLTAVVLVASGSYWVHTHPAIQARLLPFLPPLVPWLVGALVLLKLAAAWTALVALRRFGLVPDRTLRVAVIVWLIAAVVLFGGMCSFVAPSWLLAASVVLLLPFSRLAAAPLALRFNRHR